MGESTYLEILGVASGLRGTLRLLHSAVIDVRW